MIEKPQFSEAGDVPVPFEVELLARTRSEADLVLLGKRLQLELGKDLGARALGILLDELGTVKVTVPRRDQFWRRLWGEERDRIVLELSGRGDWSDGQLAAHLGISEGNVRQIRWRVRRLALRRGVNCNGGHVIDNRR